MNAEVRDFLLKARDSLRGARVLHAEGLYGFAVSRAYYARFYAAEAFLLVDGLSFSTHAGVLSEFGRTFAHTDRAPRQLHRYLMDAGTARIKGDYDPVDTVTLAAPDEHIAHAEEFLETAERLLASTSEDEP